MVRFDRGIRNLLEEAFNAGHEFSYDADNEAPDFETWLKQKSDPDAVEMSACRHLSEVSKEIRDDKKKRKSMKWGWW